VLPGAIIATFLLYLGKAKEVLKEMQPIKGILIFLLLALPWYIFVTLINGQTYIDSFFGYHNVERFTRAVNNHAAPWYFYFPIVLLGFAPWSFYLPVAIARLRFWQVTRWQQQPRLDHLGLFALVWFTVIFGFFTVAATKLPSYLLPLMPAAAILVGLLWSEQMTEPRSPRSVQISSILSLIFAGILAGVLPYSPNWIGGDPSMPNLPQVIRESSIVIRGAGIWLAVVIVGSIVLLRRQGRWIWMIHLVGFVAFLLFTVMPAVSLVDSERQLPLRQLAITIVQNQRPGEEIIMFGMKKPSLSFYTQQPITYISRINQATQYLQRKTRRSPRPQSVLVIGYPRKLQQLGLKPRRYQVIQRMGGYELIRVKPRRRVI
jgi:4-amino-4-deoxy-L-arabinose transferase-like glycosyltransferase